MHNIDKAVQGKREIVGLVLASMLAEGHVLLEDAPGTGKTSLAKALAATVQGTSARIQFTPDLLPSDVTGVTIYDQQSHRFEFHKGPIFASIVLADEINRASPKTQSALLEVMEESRVTVDGVTHETGRPFLVIATQNPIEQAGTYKLPEAQLDRFLIKTSIGYPDLAVDRADPRRGLRPQPVAQGCPRSSRPAPSPTWPTSRRPCTSSRPCSGTSPQLAEATRNDPATRLGVSVRGSIAMIRIAKVWAAAHGRHFVAPRRHQDPRASRVAAPPRARRRGRVRRHQQPDRASRACSTGSRLLRRGRRPDGGGGTLGAVGADGPRRRMA